MPSRAKKRASVTPACTIGTATAPGSSPWRIPASTANRSGPGRRRHPFDHRPRRRRDVHREPLAVEIAQKTGEASHRAAALRECTMAAAAWHARLQPADLLLGDLNEVHAAAADLDVEAAELADCVLDTVEEMCVLLDEKFRAVVAASLLVHQHREHDIARELCRLARRAQKSGHHHRDAALH